MNCTNCCDAFVGTYEGYYFTKGTDEIRLCRCCKVEYLVLGGLGWKLVENIELNPRQIARIERIRTERADKIGAYMGDIYGCCDGECEKCYRCNPLLYWLKRRPIQRQDKADLALKEIKEYKNKYGMEEVKKLNSFKNGVKYGLINEECNLKTK